MDCSAALGTPGFGAPDSQGVWQGLDPDFCRAIAAAVLGDGGRVRFVLMSGAQRMPSLQSGQVDVLAQTLTWSQSRDAAGLNFPAINFHDGQSFLVRTSANIRRSAELAGATICTTPGSHSELNLADWARSHNIRHQPVVFERTDELRSAYISGRCDAHSTDASQLAAVRSALPDPQNHVVLPERISKEPLGISGDHGPNMGLDRRWAYWAIRAVGNYGEIHERPVGVNTPIGLERGSNAPWNRGGLMYAPPIR